MDVAIRTATGQDAQAIADAHVRAWQVAYQGMIPASVLDGLDVSERAEHWHQNLTESELPDGTPSPTNLVAGVDGAVVGFACVGVWRDAPDDASIGELWAMYVHPDHWGTGAGFALMNGTFELFTQHGRHSAFLWVLEENQQARAFYERQGWQLDPVTKQEAIGDTHITERRYSITL